EIRGQIRIGRTKIFSDGSEFYRNRRAVSKKAIAMLKSGEQTSFERRTQSYKLRECRGSGRSCGIDIGLAVRRRNAKCFELAAWKINAAVDQAPKEFCKPLRVAAACGGPFGHRFSVEKDREHA